MDDHKHCEVCGKVVGLDERTCSLECAEKLEEVQKMKKRSMVIFVAIIVIVIIITKIPTPF